MARVGSTKVYNISRIVKKYMASPSLNGEAAYRKVDGYKEENIAVVVNEKQKKFEVNNFNSPENIRRVFITLKGVTIQYYTPYIKGGNKGTSTWKENKYDFNDDLMEASRQLLNYEANMVKYQNSINIGVKAEPPVLPRFTGKFMSAFDNPVAGNIEEIYFDCTYLLSEDTIEVVSKLLGIAAQNVQKLQQSILTSCIKSDIYQTSDLPKQLFMSAGVGDSRQNIRRAFPRLKVIALVSNLDGVLSRVSEAQVGRDLQFNSTYTKNDMWITHPLVSKTIKEDKIGKTTLISDLRADLDEQPLDYRTQVGVYEFDRLYLDSFFQAYVNRIKESSLENKYSEISTVINLKSSGEVYDMIKQLEEESNNNESYVRKVLMLATIDMTNKEIVEAFSKFSLSDKKKYIEYTGRKAEVLND